MASLAATALGLIAWQVLFKPADRGVRPAVAVLPFQNLSPDRRDEFFALGVHQEIISRLAMLSGIAVIERGAVMSYRDTAVAAVAKDLGAAFVLRGSLAKDSTRVSLAVELVDARDGSRLWGQRYDQDPSVASLVGVQTDVARRVAEALQISISATERARMSGRHTESATAYALYLRATQLRRRDLAGNETGNETAAELLKQAIALDSAFAAAMAELAYVYVVRSYTLGQSREWADSGAALAHRAIQLDSTLPQAYRALGRTYLDRGQLGRAASVFNQLLAVRPNDGDALLVLGWLDFLRGRLASAVELWMDARAVIPLNPTIPGDMGLVYQIFGDEEGAERWARRATLIDGQPRPQIRMLIGQGKTGEAARAVEQLLSGSGRTLQNLEVATEAMLRLGSYERARQYLEER